MRHQGDCHFDRVDDPPKDIFDRSSSAVPNSQFFNTDGLMAAGWVGVVERTENFIDAVKEGIRNAGLGASLSQGDVVVHVYIDIG